MYDDHTCLSRETTQAQGRTVEAMVKLECFTLNDAILEEATVLSGSSVTHTSLFLLG